MVFDDFGQRPFWCWQMILFWSYHLDGFSIISIWYYQFIGSVRPEPLETSEMFLLKHCEFHNVKSVFTSSRSCRSLDSNLISSLVRIKAKSPKNQNSTCEIRHQVCSGFCENLIFAEIINRIENLVLGKSQIQPSKDLWAPAEIEFYFL